MKEVVWEDSRGWKHRSLVREGLDPALGVSLDPPDLNRLDWEGVKRDLHNFLVESGVKSWREMQQTDTRGLILGAVRRRLQSLFREVEDGI